MMKMEAVESSNIKAIGYNPETRQLAVQFKSTGKTHHYENITPEDHASFMAAPSKGKHFHRHIRVKA